MDIANDENIENLSLLNGTTPPEDVEIEKAAAEALKNSQPATIPAAIPAAKKSPKANANPCQAKKQSASSTAEPAQQTVDVLTALNVWLEFISSEKGQKLLVKPFQQKNKESHREHLPLYLLAFAVIMIGAFLSYQGKMDSTMGVLLGSVMGFMLGRKNE
ncbi:hypothetical protein [Thalassomonas haliotis]|uniref:Uncharacterized protein n=1 Tax=Thalassomonas haliotis TaxID=485448 RepID=A0ABY7V9H9_9GAMM|nr:hypothetical protein [Thalassomonas haliotis]WDE09699.1 hypothetical protein H3N35_15360 [Thalassomonas haliotis]